MTGSLSRETGGTDEWTTSESAGGFVICPTDECGGSGHNGRRAVLAFGATIARTSRSSMLKN